MPSSLASIVISLAAYATVSAEDWPGWRGPRGDGTSLEANVPTRWNGQTGENVAWKTPAVGEGHGSPIVSRGHVFYLACMSDTRDRVVVCLDRKTGAKKWQQTVITCPFEAKHQLNSFASATPATDGELVYVTFLESGDKLVPAQSVSTPRMIPLGQLVVAAYDFDGKRKWIKRPGEFSSPHGFCSSPVLYRDMVIVNGDHDGDSYIVALNKTTGETVWKTPRADKTRSYVTPLIRDVDGQPQMVFSGSFHVVSLDPRDGKERWMIDGPCEQFVASMVYDGSRFFIAGGYPTFHVMAIRPDGKGNVSDTHVAWHVKNASCYVPSPIVIGDYLYVAEDRGVASCFACATGNRFWQSRLGTHYSSSLISAGGLAYFTADDGVTKIVKPGETLDVVAENPLGDFCYSSLAVSEGQIFIRGQNNVFCLGEVKDKDKTSR